MTPAKPVVPRPVSAVLLVLALVSLTLSPGLARAALSPTGIAIDGDATGPDDWDNPPTTLLDYAEITDPCGGVQDPTTLPGKLDDLVLDQPGPRPGKPNATADLCQAWYAIDAVPQPSGEYHVVLYGAWQREDTNSATSGESAVFFPLIGPQPGNADDLLLVFDYDSNTGGTTSIVLERWNGTVWEPTTVDPASYEAALDDPTGPSFGEFAIDLNLAGLISTETCITYQLIYTFTKGGTLASNAGLQDFAGPAYMTVDACSTITLTKATTPVEPDPAADFTVTTSRVDGGVVQAPDTTSVDSTLTVPGAATVTLEDVNPADDYTIEEAPAPPGWALDSIVCTAFNPQTGDIEEFTLTPGSPGFPAVPGRTSECVVTNRATTASLTIIKNATGENPPQFSFTTEGAIGEESFSLTDGQSQTFPQIPPGASTVTEQQVAGWELTGASCTGTAATPAVDITNGTVSIDLAAGERAVCVFDNTELPPPPAAITIVKDAAVEDGTPFPFTVTGPGAPGGTITLVPPDLRSSTFEVTPDEGGSDYTITETVPEGWTATATQCTINGATTTQPPGSASLQVNPGDTVLCTFTNAPVPPITLTVAKVASGDNPPDFGFAVSGGTTADFVLGAGAQQQFTDLEPGTTTVVESPAEGWTLTGIVCDGAAASIDVATGTAVLDLAPGDNAVCVYTNVADTPEPASITVVKRVASPDGTGFPFTITGPGAPADTITLTPPEPTSSTVEVTPATGGSDYTVTEAVPAGWDATATVCTINGQDTAQQPGSASFTLNPGDTAVCTFTNAPTPPAPTLRITKFAEGDDTPPSFDFSAAGGTTADFSLTHLQSWDSGPLTPGTTTVTETPATGWSLTDIACSGADATVDITTGTLSVDLAAGDAAVCVFVNRQDPPEPASLTIVKEVAAPDGTSFDFAVTGPGAPTEPVILTPPTDDSTTLSVTPARTGSTYTLAEAVPDGWTAVATSCAVNGQVSEQPAGSASLDLSPSDVAVCTFRNDPIPPITLTVAKVAGGENPPQFGFAVSGGASADFTLGDQQWRTFTDVQPGATTITEAATPGWTLTEVRCSVDNAAIDLASGTATVDLVPGDEAVCVFDNTADVPPPASLTIVKDVANPDGTSFEFTATGPGAPAGTITLTPPDQGSATYEVTPAAGGSDYTIAEAVPSGWDATATLCTVNDQQIPQQAGSASLTLAPGDTAICTFSNAPQTPPASLTVVKTVSGENPPPFDFTVTGAADATFSLGNGDSSTISPVQPGTATITEAPDPAWIFEGATCSGGAEVDLATATVTVDIAAGEQVVCVFGNAEAPPAPASLTLVKQVPSPDGTQFPFSVTGPGAPADAVRLAPPAQPSATLELTPAQGGSDYAITEALPDGWTATATECSVNGSSSEQSPGAASLTLNPGDTAICTFSNAPVPPISLTVVKVARGDIAPEFGFTLQGGAEAQFDLGDRGQRVFTGLQPGTTTITETPTEGWRLAGAQCDGADATIDLASGTAVLDLVPGDEVVCLFGNVPETKQPPPATITVLKDVEAPDGTAFPFTISGPGAPAAGFALTPPDAATQTFVVTPDEAGSNYTVAESVPAGWQATSTVCTVAGQERAQRAGSAEFTLSPGQAAFCTFTNVPEPPPASLTVVKAAEGENPPAFDFTVAGGAADAFSLGSGQSRTISPVQPGTTTITEAPTQGWSFAGATCSTEATIDRATATVTLDIAAGDQVVCLFGNLAEPPPAASLTIVKQVEQPDGTSFPFTISGPGAPTESVALTPPDTSSASFEVTPDAEGSTYTIGEELPQGWDAVGTTCTINNRPAAAAPGEAAITLVPGDTALCTFSNAPQQARGSLTVTKQTDPPGTLPQGQDGFPFIISGFGQAGSFQLADGDRRTFEGLPAGTYILIERVPAGWSAEIACTGEPATTVEDLGAGRVQISLAAGDDVTCAYRNVLLPQLQITKAADPQSPQDFAFTASRDGDPYSSFLLDDDGSVPTQPAGDDLSNTTALVDLAPGTWLITEEPVGGWSLRDITCTGATATPDLQSGSVLVVLEAGQVAQCTFANAQADVPPPIGPPVVEPPVGPGGGTGTIPDTGADVGGLALLGLTLVLAGAFAVGLARRPKRG